MSSLVDIDYVFDTMREDALKDADHQESVKWAKNSKWLGLKIINTSDIDNNTTEGQVEFIASYILDNQTHNLKEHSNFKRIDNRWYYVGDYINDVVVNHEPIRVGTKIGRNDPCTCGSGKKYKKCCLA